MNGNPAKKIKIADTLRRKGDIFAYHELGKLRLTKEDKNVITDGKRLNNLIQKHPERKKRSDQEPEKSRDETELKLK